MAFRMFEEKEHAESYWKHRISPSELIENAVQFLEEKKRRPLELAVDVGCGSGQGTVVLAKHFESVVGTDVSLAQIEMARRHSGGSNITYKESAAEVLMFADGSVDLVSSISAFHWFDRPRFLREVDRVLKPGGCLALLNFTTNNMELSFPGCCLVSLNQVCKEFYASLSSYWSPHLNNNMDKYIEAYSSTPYPDKQWREDVWVRRRISLSSFIGLVESFSSYQALLKEDPQKAVSLSRDVSQRLMSVMGVTSAETEVEVGVKYYYVLARKPPSTS